MLWVMFVVTESEAAIIRAVFEQRGELSAVVELRRLFPGIRDNVQARQCVLDHCRLAAVAGAGAEVIDGAR
jgi:hypothetical protein